MSGKIKIKIVILYLYKDFIFIQGDTILSLL